MPELPISDIIIGERHRKNLGDISSLAQSIQAVGLLHPIVVKPDNTLVAGERRLAAVRSLDWKSIPVTVVHNLTDTLLALKAERDENTCRQGLSPSEAVSIGQSLEEMEGAAARERQRQAGEQYGIACGKFPQAIEDTGKTRDKVGAAVGMSGKTYRKAKAVVEAAEEDPDTFGDLTKLMDTTGKVDRAYKQMQQRVKEKAVTTLLSPESLDWPSSIQLIHGDFAEVAHALEPESFDLILTDPPYPRQYLHLYELLAEQSARLLRPGGSCLAMAGQSYIPEILEMMGRHLTYHWLISYDTPGGQSPQIWTRKVNAFWKPVLWYVKGEYDGNWHGDKIASNVNDNDKRFHGWGQSESGIGKLVAEFAAIGTGRVLDPFLGGGTTAVACYRLRIPFIGIDKDLTCIETTKRRIWEEVHNGT